MIVKELVTDVAGAGYCRVYNNQCQFLDLPNLYCYLYKTPVYIQRKYDYDYVISTKDCRREIKEALDHSIAWSQQEKLKVKFGGLDNES